MTVTVQTVPAGMVAVGVSVKLEAGDALSVNGTAEPTGHSRVKELVVACTLSLKLTMMGVFPPMPVAPLTGDVVSTVGAASVVKLKTKLDTIVSGGSNASVS